MLPHRAHEGASAQGVLEQREERGWELWSTRGLYFQIPRSAWSRLPPGAHSSRCRARKQSVHIIAVAGRACQCLKRCLAHPDTC